MTKRNLLLIMSLVSIMMYSCQKEKNEMQATTEPEADVLVMKAGGNSSFVDPSLKARYEFDMNLAEYYNNLPPGVPSGAISFTADRKGFANKALKLNGASKVTFSKVPVQTNSSISLWAKYDAPVPSQQILIPSTEGLGFTQQNYYFLGQVHHPFTNSIWSPRVNNSWHHLVITFDGTAMRFYVDGKIVGTLNHPGTIDGFKTTYTLGYFLSSYWKGSIDDMRFYNKTLAAGEVWNLFNL